MDDQVATEDRQTGVGALVTRVDGAVGVLHDVLDDQLLLGAEAYLLGRVGGAGLLLLDERGARGRRQLKGAAARVAAPVASAGLCAAALPVVRPVARRAPAATAVAMARVVRL